jgi:CheY-like chemotaxis protein
MEAWTMAFALLPQTDGESEEAIHKAGGGGSGAQIPTRVLVADDDSFFRSIVTKVVTSVGHFVDTAKDGVEAWDALHSERYDLLVTDHLMPRLTGLDLILRLRAESPSPPCILMSADLPRPAPVLRKLVHPGAVLEKPFFHTQLVEIMNRLLLGQTVIGGTSQVNG